MISDELKQLASINDREEDFVRSVIHWYFDKEQACKNHQDLKTLLYQIDYNWDTIRGLKKGGFRDLIGAIYENRPGALLTIEELLGWQFETSKK